MNIPKINMEAIKGTAKGAIRSVGNFASKNAPVIAASAAILCSAGAIIATVKATKRYEEEIQKAEISKNEDFIRNATKSSDEKDENAPEEFGGLTKTEKLLIAAKCYWLVALLFVLGGGAAIASVKFSNKQIQALAILASTSEAALARNEKVIEDVLGKGKLDKIKMESNKQELSEVPIPVDDELIERSSLGGNTLMFDTMSHRYFYGDITKIEHAINEVNATLLRDVGYVSINEFYSALGLEGVEWGEYLGWNMDDFHSLIDVKLEYDREAHKRPVVLVKCKTQPRHDWRNY